MKIIESTTNAFLKTVKKLHQKKYREEYGQYLIEGEHLIEEALKSKAELIYVMTTQEGFDKYGELLNLVSEDKKIQMTESCFKVVSELSTPSDLIAVIKKDNEEIDLSFTRRTLLLDRIQDPGNLGTIIRTADAAGFQSVVLGQGCVDLYQSKVQRALQGSQFHLSIANRVDLVDWIHQANEKGIKTIATALNKDAKSFKEMNHSESLAIVMGNEGSGVSEAILSVVNETVYIPMRGEAESLNVAIAAGIIMFEIQS